MRESEREREKRGEGREGEGERESLSQKHHSTCMTLTSKHLCSGIEQ